MADKNKKSTQAIILEKVTSLEIAVLGHPQAPADDGLMGDVKHIRKLAEKTNGRVDNCETAIALINTRCEERHGLNATVKKVSLKKVAGIGGGSLTAIATIFFGIGKLAGWW